MSASRFAKLVDLAQASDSERRRDLLREVTDLFFETTGGRTDRENALFDEVLRLVAGQMQDSVLAELAEVFADAADAPVGLMNDLANHAFSIAAPVLSRSTALDEQTLLRIVSRQSQHHIKAVAERTDVSEKVADAIVRMGDDYALDALIRNEGAQISRPSMEAAVDRAQRNPRLHDAVVTRRDLPLDLLNEMYFVVETALREKILERNASVDPATLDAALAKARERMRQSATDLSVEARNARSYIRACKTKGELNARLLVALYREAKQMHFIYGLAEITQVDHETISDLLRRRDIDGLAMICRAAGIERPLFVTLAVLTCGGDEALARAEEFGRMYNAVPMEAAQRAVRFFKLRKNNQAA